nr:hypothetical transcript [Hymenolepis microstoma]
MSLILDTPEVANPTNDNIPGTTRQATNSGIEESKGVNNNFNTSLSTTPNSTDDLNGRTYDLQNNSALFNSSIPQSQNCDSFPPLQNATLDLFLDLLFTYRPEKPELLWSIGFMIENLLLMRDASAQHGNIAQGSPFAEYKVAQSFPYRVEDLQYYKNFDKQKFIDAMTAQTIMGKEYHKFFTFIAYILEALYTMAIVHTEAKLSNSVLVAPNNILT